jgi:hypothetical protein
MTFFDIILFAVIFSLGYKLGEFFAVYRMLEMFKTITGKELSTEEIEKAGDERIEEIKSIYLFETETVNDVLYLYNRKKEFICQASSLEELCKKCIEYTKLSKAIVVHDSHSYYTNGVTIEKINENSIT